MKNYTSTLWYQQNWNVIYEIIEKFSERERQPSKIARKRLFSN